MLAIVATVVVVVVSSSPSSMLLYALLQASLGAVVVGAPALVGGDCYS